MKIPYNQIHVNQGIIFGARSGQIHTFSLDSRKLIQAWKHPDAPKVDDQPGAAGAPEDSEEPPSKRQRTLGDDDVSTSKATEEAPQSDQKPGEDEAQGLVKGSNNEKRGKRGQRSQRAQPGIPDRPVINKLTSTEDGRYLVAVSGHDKAIRVFEHDGDGQLTLLSQR